MNDNVIVYRSRSEQAVDDFWWSEGYFTATKSGDFILGGIIVVAVIIAISVIAGGEDETKLQLL